MALIIRKKSNFTFEHYFNGATVPYITNVFNINNGGNETFQLVDYRGANLQAVPINQITLYDDTTGGSAETFTTFAQLNTRLGQLNYPPMRGENAIPSDFNLRVQEDEETPIQNVNKIIFSGATVTDNADGSVTVTITGSIGSQTFQQVYDASDPPVINAEENGGIDTYFNVFGLWESGQFASQEQINSEVGIDGDTFSVYSQRNISPTSTNFQNGKINETTEVYDTGSVSVYLGKVSIGETKLKDSETATVKIGFEDLDEPTTTQTWDWQVPKDETPGTIKFASRKWVEDNFSGSIPTLQEVTDEGNETTNSIRFNTAGSTVEIGCSEVSGQFYFVQQESSNFKQQFSLPGHTDDRDVAFPDKNGIVAYIDDIPTNTSDLINDGQNGTSPYVTADQLPSNLNLYATNVSSDIATYFKLVTSIDDPDYNDTAVNIPTGAITTTGQFIAALATTANVLVGNPGIINILTVGNIRRTSGTGTAEFYYEVYHRNSGGTETLIATSSKTPPVSSSVYTEFLAAALLNNGTFLATDRIVVKYYADRIAGGSNPNYDFQFGGTSPVRTNFPIPATNIPLDSTPTDGSTNGVQSNGVFDALALKADLSSPALTGSPTAPTQTANDNSTKIATTAYADAKVTDAIVNGVTNVAPSQNAVFDALALKADLVNVEEWFIVQNGSLGVSSNSLAETVLYSVNITGAKYVSGDYPLIKIGATKTATNGNVTYRIRVGINGDTSDALFATITIGAANSRIVNFERVCAYFDSATTILTFAPASTTITDTNALGNPKLSVSLNPSNAWKITITAQLTSTSDSCSVDSVRIGKLKK